ncbi:MAG: 1-deoxy-D-xylulose-5-phosphate reductoisomerase [Candidatus Omnitrophota bacterium]|jgi:1-deoxy-D-xylulose-5-phosphate reductoisomerase
MKNIVILGSTGSIGQNALDVVRRHPDTLRVVGLSAHSNVKMLEKQINEFKPKIVCLTGRQAPGISYRAAGMRLLAGKEGLKELCVDPGVDLVVVAISGSAALAPLLTAVEQGKTIALANKEALVMAGPLVMRAAAKSGVRIIPIDSEQSAIWQCICAGKGGTVKKILLTASGGPLREVSREDLGHITVKQVLRHPRWKMGKKITVDSATLMNKGFELLEAIYLFGVPADAVKVLIHPEAIIHSMVEFIDGVIMAQLSATDMRIPIQYALTYPQRLQNRLPGVDFFKLKALHFHKPDTVKFPCLDLAYQAARAGGTLPCVLNAANEICVEEFLRGDLSFVDIPKVIGKVVDKHRNTARPVLEDIFQADAWARIKAREALAKL